MQKQKTRVASNHSCTVHAAGGPRRKWSGRTKHGATNGPPGLCTAATVGPPIEHELSIRNTVMKVVLYQYGLIAIATTVFPEMNGKTRTLSRDITAVISTIPAMSAVVSGHNIIR